MRIDTDTDDRTPPFCPDGMSVVLLAAALAGDVHTFRALADDAAAALDDRGFAAFLAAWAHAAARARINSPGGDA